MVENVLAVTVSTWEKPEGNTTVYGVLLEGRAKPINCYDPAGATLEIGKPLPEGWEIATSKNGNPFIKPPKKGGGGKGAYQVAYRNTAEGQAYEQERMDRRTALMQAVVFDQTTMVLKTADDLYRWLRKTVGVAEALGKGTAAPTTTSGESTPPEKSPAPPAGTEPEGTGPSDPPSGAGDHEHFFVPMESMRGREKCDCGLTRKIPA